MDCIYMAGSKENNDGFKFLLSIIDCYTKFAWLFKLKNLKCENIIYCLRLLFSKPENIPQKIGTDRGSGKYINVVTLEW